MNKVPIREMTIQRVQNGWTVILGRSDPHMVTPEPFVYETQESLNKAFSKLSWDMGETDDADAG